MKYPLIIDKRNFKWNLLSNILIIFDSRRTRREIAKTGVKPANTSVKMLKILFLAIFFSQDISYVRKELNHRPELRKFVGINKVSTETELSRFISRLSDDQFINMVLMVLNTISTPRRREKAWIVIDSTDIQLDLNWLSHKISKKSLTNKEFKWGYSPSKSFYIGYKLTLAIDYHSRKPLAFLIHEGSPHDTRIFTEIIEELRRRRLIEREDIILMDKKYSSYKNYLLVVSRYQIVPLIFPKSDYQLKRAIGILSYLIPIFKNSKLQKDSKQFFIKLKNEFKRKIKNWQYFKSKRGIIEDMFKLAKESLDLRKMHRYTMKSVTKHVSLNVLLLETIVTLGYRSKTALQTLAET